MPFSGHDKCGDESAVADLRQKEDQLLAKLGKLKAEAKDQLSEETGISDEEILNDLQGLGYTRSTIENLLPLLPLVEVAWAEGNVTDKERERVLELAARRGIMPDSPEYQQLTEWLREKPADEFFRRTMRIIRAFLNTLAPAKRSYHRTKVISDCLSVAKASGGLFGFGNKISDVEMEMMEKIIEDMQPRS